MSLFQAWDIYMAGDVATFEASVARNLAYEAGVAEPINVDPATGVVTPA
jgi:hypothetical protein